MDTHILPRPHYQVKGFEIFLTQWCHTHHVNNQHQLRVQNRVFRRLQKQATNKGLHSDTVQRQRNLVTSCSFATDKEWRRLTTRGSTHTTGNQCIGVDVATASGRCQQWNGSRFRNPWQHLNINQSFRVTCDACAAAFDRRKKSPGPATRLHNLHSTDRHPILLPEVHSNLKCGWNINRYESCRFSSVLNQNALLLLRRGNAFSVSLQQAQWTAYADLTGRKVFNTRWRAQMLNLMLKRYSACQVWAICDQL